MSRWSPAGLPKIRHQVTQYLTEQRDVTPAPDQAAYRIPRGVDPRLVEESRSLAEAIQTIPEQVAAAELYWVTSDMAALAVAAGRTLPDVDLHTPPAPLGLAAFDGGIGMIEGRFGPLPVDALSWAPAAPGTLRVWAWSARHRLTLVPVTPGGGHDMPPLIPTRWALLQRDAPDSDLIPDTVIRALAAAWHLMQQPTLVDRTREEATGKDARALTRAGADRDVTIIDLRRAYAPDDREETMTSAGRAYKHRWVVSGHWRDQAHGTNRALRRRQWIAAHVKGPDGAPLLATERVNVWRR